MSKTKPVSIVLLDKEYKISCSEEERVDLHAAVDFINNRMQNLRQTNNTIGTERIAVITALNLASEFLKQQRNNMNYTGEVSTAIKRLSDKIDNALIADRSIVK